MSRLHVARLAKGLGLIHARGLWRMARTRLARLRREALAESFAAEDLLTWGLRYLPQHFARPPSAMHRFLAAELDAMRRSRGTKLNVLGPRGSAKSTVATLAYVLRSAVEGTEPYIWIISDTRQQAAAHLENVKSELTENRLLAEAHPDAAGIGPVWRAGAIVLRNRVMIEAFGAGQKVRGKRRRAARPTLVVCDDIQNDSHATSRVRRDHCRAWFAAAVLQAGTTATNYVHLATALHREALAMELDRTPGWRSRKFKAIESYPTNAELWRRWRAIYSDLERPDAGQAALDFYEEHRTAMDEGAAVLWPESESLYRLMCLEAEVGRTAFEREKQSSPIDPERCEFPEECFSDLAWFDEWPASLVLRVLALDPSKGNADRLGDYSAYILAGADASGLLYVQADLARRTTTRMVADGVTLAREFRADVIGVEANQFQDLLAEQIAAALAAEGLSTAMRAIHNHVPKAVRIRRLEALLASRRLRFKASCPSTRLLIEQLRDFPIGDHDDGPDALEMAVRLLAAADPREANDGLGARLAIG